MATLNAANSSPDLKGNDDESRLRSDSSMSAASTMSAATGRGGKTEKRAFAFFVWSPEKKQTYGAYAHLGVTLTLRGESQATPCPDRTLKPPPTWIPNTPDSRPSLS